MYSFTSGTIFSAGTDSPSMPGTQPVSLNISLASLRRDISCLDMVLLMSHAPSRGYGRRLITRLTIRAVVRKPFKTREAGHVSASSQCIIQYRVRGFMLEGRAG